MIAFQKNNSGFSKRWIDYCEVNKIPLKLVDFYDSNIIEDLRECKAVMWHFSHMGHKDFLMAKQLIYALQQSGMKVFPDFNTMWHFDDKVGQKYLLEQAQVPLVKTWVFYDLKNALQWVNDSQFPKVFKLRGGAGSVNVKLVRTEEQGKKLVKKAFGKGFKNSSLVPFSEVLKKFKGGKASSIELAKSFARIFIPTNFSKMNGRERGYVYFQDFIPNNLYDIRIIVIDGKAFGLKRFVRENDFRASGSGDFAYEREAFDERCIRISFDTSAKLQLQCAAYDFVFDEKNTPLIVEVSYGFSAEVYDPCPGYWDEELTWHEGKFNPQAWMVDTVLKGINAK
jgi:glutathione synthase/RimK-type ligase-like ATP-grasp enzyme